MSEKTAHAEAVLRTAMDFMTGAVMSPYGYSADDHATAKSLHDTVGDMLRAAANQAAAMERMTKR